MLKIETNKDGDIYISGDLADLRDLKYQLEETMEHNMSFTKQYHDFKWNSNEKSQPSKNVTVRITQ
jgi:hypothetical protein